MKIGFFTDTYFPQINGVTYTISLWKKELEKLGHEVFVYYPDDESYTPARNEVPLPSFPYRQRTRCSPAGIDCSRRRHGTSPEIRPVCNTPSTENSR